MLSADGSPSPVIVKSRAPADGEVGRTDKLSGNRELRCQLAALGDEVVVPDQILGSELCRYVALHVRVGFRIGPIALQCAKPSPDARTSP